MQRFSSTVEVDDGKVIVTLPKECSDIALDYQSLFRFADSIGSLACQMADHVSNPAYDAVEADCIRLHRLDTKTVVIYLRHKTRQVRWTKNVALLVAEKMAQMAEDIAGQVR